MSAGALVAQRLNPFAAAGGPGRSSWKGRTATTPMIITSHPNETGRQAIEIAWEILSSGGSALDAVEKATNHIEKDPEDASVGYGGLPNELGVVQLDASIMDGKTYSAGSVSSLENIMHPASVARLVMERTDHVMLVGPGALEFAKSWGFPEEDLLTDKARDNWLSVQPTSSATACSLSTHSSTFWSATRPFIHWFCRSSLARLSPGRGWPGLYLPVSRPCSSGENTTWPMPCSRQNGSTSTSRSRISML